MPLTVIAILTTPSATRLGRRAATRKAISSVMGRRAEIAINQPMRWGGRGESASALTVLERAARTAGMTVATTATASATAVTEPTVDMVIDGVPALPMRPELDSVSNGAVSDPTANPAAAATVATRTYSASST